MAKLDCNKCGGKMKITTEGVHVIGGGPSPIIKLRCEACNITRFEQRADIERELSTSGGAKKWWQFWK